MPNPSDGVIAAYGNTLSKTTAGDTMAGPLTCASTLTVTGASTLTGNVAVGGNLAVTGAITGGSTNTAGGATAVTPTFSSGVAAQLSDKTRDYQIYLQFGALGTALSVAIGPTSTPANTIISSAAVVAGEVISFRLPAGWYATVTFTTTTLANQAAISC